MNLNFWCPASVWDIDTHPDMKPQLIWCETSFESCGYHPVAIEIASAQNEFPKPACYNIDLAAL